MPSVVGIAFVIVIAGLVIVVTTLGVVEIYKMINPPPPPPPLNPLQIGNIIRLQMPGLIEVQELVTNYASVDGPDCAEAITLLVAIEASIQQYSAHPDSDPAVAASFTASLKPIKDKILFWCHTGYPP